MINKLISISPMAGRAKRLRPFPIPKDIYPLIKGQEVVPICMFNLEEIKRLGCQKFVFVIKSDKQKDMRYLSAVFEPDQAIYLCQEISNGLPYALLQSQPFISDNEIGVLSMPDTFIHPSGAFEECLKSFSDDTDLAIAYFPVENCKTIAKFGVQRIGSRDMIWGFVMFKPKFIQFVRDCLERDKAKILEESENGEPKFKTFLSLAKEHLRVKEILLDGYQYFDLGNSQYINEAQEFLLNL